MATVLPYPGLGAFTLFAKKRLRHLIEPNEPKVVFIHEPFAKAGDARACCARVGLGGCGHSGSGRVDRCATGGRPRLSDRRTRRGLCRVSARQRGCRRRERSDGQDKPVHTAGELPQLLRERRVERERGRDRTTSRWSRCAAPASPIRYYGGK